MTYHQSRRGAVAAVVDPMRYDPAVRVLVGPVVGDEGRAGRQAGILQPDALVKKALHLHTAMPMRMLPDSLRVHGRGADVKTGSQANILFLATINHVHHHAA